MVEVKLFVPTILSFNMTIKFIKRTNRMFIILLKFSDNKKDAKAFMQAHKDWIRCGFDERVFLVVGNLKATEPSASGGGIVAHNTSLQDLKKRVNEDPFVENNIVTAEILEICPNQADERLNFLLD